MSWKPQGGGGPWGGGGGGGGQGPWGGGSGSGGGGQQPPDIEEMLRRSQDNLKKYLPGGMGSMPMISLAVLVALVLWALSGLYSVNAGHQGVALLFGKYDTTTAPGMNWYFPAPFGEVLVVNVENVRRTDIGFRGPGESTGFTRAPAGGQDVLEESLMLTSDQNIADVDFTVQWKVKDAGHYLFNIRDPETTVKLAAESAIREVVGQTTLQDAMTGGRQQVAESTRNQLQDILDLYQSGIVVTQVQLLKADPPAEVIDAFNEVQRARQDKERKKNEADAYANRILPTARGEAEKMIREAEAYKERVVKDAEGEAKRFTSVYESYAVAKEVTIQRLYIEAMEEVLSNSTMTLIDPQGQGSGVVPYLPLSEMRKSGGDK